MRKAYALPLVLILVYLMMSIMVPDFVNEIISTMIDALAWLRGNQIG